MKNFTYLKGSIAFVLLVFFSMTRLSAQGTPNLWATSSNGTIVSSYTVSNGTYIAGPVTIFDPTFGGTVTSTAALGRSNQPNLTEGYFYWLPNNFNSNDGLVQVYGATATGANRTLIGSLDINGPSNNDFGFVRLCMGPDGRGWILASDGTTLYLVKFKPNGVNLLSAGPAADQLTVEDANVDLSAGALVSTFFNGDICMSGTGTIFALANNGSTTQIFVGTPSGASTLLTKKWDLLTPAGNPFNISVNGVAFDVLGSLYVSTGNGLYFINQATVNGPAGTVTCALVQSQTGLQDLASNFFPEQSALPVTLTSFAGSYNNQKTNLNWVTENTLNFNHFEIERSADGRTFVSVGSKQPQGNGADKVQYLYSDDLSLVNGNVFYYRLKMIDADGHFKYSNVILVRKEQKSLATIVVSPNPLISGTMATVRFTAASKSSVEFNVLDISGRIVLKQQNTVFEGTNSVSINNVERLQPGTYILKMNDAGSIMTTKFAVVR